MMQGMGPQRGMGMMKEIMGGEGGSPMERGMAMCREMMASIQTLSRTTALAAPELRPLFDDWLATVEEELLTHLERVGPMELTALAEEIGLTPETTAHLLGRMAATGTITLRAERAHHEAAPQ